MALATRDDTSSYGADHPEAGYCFYNGASGASVSTTTANASSSARADSVSPAELEHASRCAFQVPYSLHSNYTELRSFVAALRPRQIIPTVSCGVEADVSVGLDQLCADLAHDSAASEDARGSAAAYPTLLQRKPPPLAAVSVQADCRAQRHLNSAMPQGSMDVASLAQEGDSLLQRSSSGQGQGHSCWQALWSQSSQRLQTGRKESTRAHMGSIQPGQSQCGIQGLVPQKQVG
ncbi:g11480 [Coccomyxa viridis]|uniref:G11480 protein n=1 Tax=Coccomyxa viridis TaxID=1274662 RepID=A0ABP1GAP5_9CHLO